MAKSKPAEHPRQVLVLGDWMIDEYWTAGTMRSPTASRPGRDHLRGLNRPDSSVQELAGAGRVAMLLRSAGYAVHGVGMWHTEDTKTIASLFERENAKSRTPGRLSVPKLQPVSTNAPKLLSLANVIGLPESDQATTRVVRINQKRGSKWELLMRVDWDATPTRNVGHQKVWIANESDMLHANGVFGRARNADEHIDDIVLVDMCKGVVSPYVVALLAELHKEAHWHVYSKSFAPDYLDTIPSDRLLLYYITDLAAKDAYRKQKVHQWFCGPTRGRRSVDEKPKPTPEAIKAIDGLIEGALQKQKHCAVVAIPDNLRILAKMSSDAAGLMRTDSPPVSEGAVSSAFFPALVHAIVQKGRGKKPLDTLGLKEAIERSLQFAKDYNQEVAVWIRAEDSSDKVPRLPTSLDGEPLKLERTLESWGANDKFAWEEATRTLGVVSVGSKEPYIDLWRSMIEVNGYVCLVPSRRKALARLVEELRQFKQRSAENSVSGILIAKPGSGKTTLVRNLAESAGMQPLDFNITQMISRRDVLAAFDTIMTTQAQSRSPLLVFFDEINARLENQHVYDMFLAPLLDRNYLRDGKKYALPPCVWLFAGTALPSAGEGSADPSVKAKDFEDRMTLPTLDLTSPLENDAELGRDRLRELARLENVYRGLVMLRRTYPEVSEVTQGFLEYLSGVREDISAREIQRIVDSLVEVGSCVSLLNLPEPRFDKMAIVKVR